MRRLDIKGDEEIFLKLIEELKEHIIIVEGKKDVRALKSLGIDNIIAINGQPHVEILGKIYKYIKHPNFKESSIVILTDFDTEGKKLASKFKLLFQKYHIKCNSRLRNKFMRFGKSKIEEFRKGWLEYD